MVISGVSQGPHLDQVFLVDAIDISSSFKNREYLIHTDDLNNFKAIKMIELCSSAEPYMRTKQLQKHRMNLTSKNYSEFVLVLEFLVTVIFII